MTETTRARKVRLGTPGETVERVKPDPTKGKKMPVYQVIFDLKSLPFSEQIEWECDDGQKRYGMFIPYEENNAYVNDKHAYLNFQALARPMKERRKAVGGANQTHELRPYWTREQTKKMNDMGFFKKLMVHGWLKIMYYVTWGTEFEKNKD